MVSYPMSVCNRSVCTQSLNMLGAAYIDPLAVNQQFVIPFLSIKHEQDLIERTGLYKVAIVIELGIQFLTFLLFPIVLALMTSLK